LGKILAFYLENRFNLDIFEFLSLGYLVFGAIAFFFLVIPIWWETRKRELSLKYLTVLLVALLCSVLGARVIPIGQYIRHNGFTWNALFHGGIVFYGGLLFGFLALVAGLRLCSLKPFPFLDIVAVFVPLTHSFGRIGCFLGGYCFGKTTEHAWGVCYPVGTGAFRQHMAAGFLDGNALASLPVVPVQLMEAILNIVLFFFLLLTYQKKTFRPGTLVVFYLTAYSLERFVLELWRDDHIRGLYAGLSTSQYISLGVAIGIIIFMSTSKWRTEKTPPLAGV